MNISANNVTSLLDKLSQLNVYVPPRMEGRTTAHVERYSGAHLLSSLAKNNYLSYPLSFLHTDRPDFKLSMNSETIGIEHTEAVPQNEAHRSVLRQSISRNDVYFISRSIPGEKKKKAKKLLSEIQSNDLEPAWAGDSVEQEWVAAMFDSTKRKLAATSLAGYERLPQQWLLIYDNWPMPAFELSDASKCLHSLFIDNRVFDEFKIVFIISSNNLAQLDKFGVRIMPIHDLWSS